MTSVDSIGNIAGTADIELVDYESAVEQGVLEINIGQEMIDLFRSERCTGDYNELHDSERYMETKIGKMFGTHIVPGFMLIGISELFGYEWLKRIGEKNGIIYPNLRVSKQSVNFGLPVLPGRRASISILPGDGKELGFIVETPKPRNKDKTTKAIKHETVGYERELAEKELGDVEVVYETSRTLTGEHLANFFGSLAYSGEECPVPHTFLAASTVSKALLEWRDASDMKTAAYKKLDIEYFRDADRYEPGERLDIIVAKEDKMSVYVTDKDYNVLVQASADVKFD